MISSRGCRVIPTCGPPDRPCGPRSRARRRRGWNITVAFDRPAQPSEVCRRQFLTECTQLAPLLHVGDGWRARWYVLDGVPDPFAVTVVGLDPAAFERTIERTRPILDSLRIDR